MFLVCHIDSNIGKQLESLPRVKIMVISDVVFLEWLDILSYHVDNISVA